jgi:hypothetical protein
MGATYLAGSGIWQRDRSARQLLYVTALVRTTWPKGVEAMPPTGPSTLVEVTGPIALRRSYMLNTGLMTKAGVVVEMLKLTSWGPERII